LRPEEIVEKFYSALLGDSPYSQPKGSVSVTQLSFPCLRRAVIEILSGISGIDPGGLIRTWIGKKCHETSILRKKMELELQWEGVYGRVDEYDPDSFVLIDKKFTRSVPSEVREHHARQVNYYRVLLEKNGMPVSEMYVVYVDVDAAFVRVLPVEMMPLEEAEAELVERRDRVLECVKTGILPPREVRFWEEGARRTVCDYCSVFSVCFASDITLVLPKPYTEE
jgi:CRISPR/Cas system-associated exonuclease Cas4 (RecB family)